MGRRNRWRAGTLMIDGKLVQGCDLRIEDCLHETVAPEDVPGLKQFTVKGRIDVDRGEFARFLEGVGIDYGADPLFDMTVWCAVDPRGPMPILQVGRHTDVITVCQRGGGSIGRVWKGCCIAEGKRVGELEVDVYGEA